MNRTLKDKTHDTWTKKLSTVFKEQNTNMLAGHETHAKYLESVST